MRKYIALAAILLLSGCVLVPLDYGCDRPWGGLYFGVLCPDTLTEH